MAKFCSKCGKPLVDGVPCDCEKQEVKQDVSETKEEKVEVKDEKIAEAKPEVKDEKVTEAKSEAKDEKGTETKSETNESEIPSAVGVIFGQYIESIKGLFKKPEDTIKKEYKNFNLAIAAIVINAIIFGILANGFLGRILSKIGVSLQIVNNLLTSLAQYGIKISLSNIGIKCGIGMAVMSALIAGIIFVMNNYVYKKKIDIKDCVGIVGVCEIFLTIGYIITFIVSYISIMLSIFLMLLFTLVFFIHIHLGLISISQLSKNQIVYTVLASIFIPFIAMLIITYILVIADLAVIAYKSAVSSISNSLF